MRIWLERISFASCPALSATAWGVRLLTTNVETRAPARSKARAESNSQFVPGKTGMTTLGFATFTAGAWRTMPWDVASKLKGLTVAPLRR